MKLVQPSYCYRVCLSSRFVLPIFSRDLVRGTNLYSSFSQCFNRSRAWQFYDEKLSTNIYYLKSVLYKFQIV